MGTEEQPFPAKLPPEDDFQKSTNQSVKRKKRRWTANLVSIQAWLLTTTTKNKKKEKEDEKTVPTNFFPFFPGN